MTDIDRCEIFIATFIATLIIPFDENRLKPNTWSGVYRLSRHLLISRLCYENCESIVRFVNPQTFQEPLDSSVFRWQS